MSPSSSSASYGLRTFATTLTHRYKAISKTEASNPSYQHIKFGYGTIGSSRYHALCMSCGGSTERPESKMEDGSNFKVQPSEPDPPRANMFSWVKWLFGSTIPLLFSFWKQKLDSMLKLEGKQIDTNVAGHNSYMIGKVEGVVKEVEEVAEAVEKVASTTEKLSAEVAERLDNGELKEVALMVEHVSNVISKDARMTEDFIHKVGDVKQDLTDLEAMVEQVIGKNKK